MLSLGMLLLMLVVILIAAEVFTNALEHLGERIGISEGVTGSLFAAVGTAMPETMVPLLAVFAGTDNHQLNEEIGVGAILGAPLMLATLSLFLMAMSVYRARGAGGALRPEHTGLTRDLNFFLLAFSFAAVALFVPHDLPVIRTVIGFIMVFIYFIYVMLTLRASADLVKDGHGTEAEEAMFFARIGLPTNMFTILLQLTAGLALLIAGAKGFISGVEGASQLLSISPLLLSLIIVPVATELPEKVNSILWIRRGKDTLAFGNITGALVFQGTLLPAIGITLTPWLPEKQVLGGVLITLVAMVWMRYLAARGHMKVWHLIPNGLLYVSYLIYALW